LRVLLDENFPLQLYQHLLARGHEVEHIIVLGQRGVADSEIVARLAAEAELVFVTQDDDFTDVVPKDGGAVIISRVPQSLPIRSRVDLWSRALEGFLAEPPSGRLFELLATGEIVAWEIHEPR
jgi:hypothetical protein